MADEAKERTIPAVLIVIGFVLYVIAAYAHAGASGVMPTLMGVLIGGILQTIILIGAAFLVSSVLGVSFGEVPSAILKFAGAALVAGGVATLIPYGGIVALFVFLGLVMWLFDLEVVYAVALTVVNFVINFIISMALAAM